MRIAVEGCSHGCLDQIYASILALDRRDGKKTDLVLLCGDVQTLRNAGDLHCLAVPDKYKQMGDFHRYYSNERQAPILTLMIGGNHEASNYLWELYYGGWVAPNIYYLGAAGCVDVGGLTITGISGIYKSHDYTLGRFERMPYDRSTIRSIYHTRSFDVFRLRLLAKLHAKQDRRVSISLSHDWPNTIEQHGDVEWLKWRKPFFKQEIESQTLGSPPLMDLLHAIQPAYWLAAHLHVRFAALVKHDGGSTTVVKNKQGNAIAAEPAATVNASNSDEIAIDDDDDADDDEAAVQGTSSDTQSQRETRFLALSKCLKGEDFLQVLDVPAPYDEDEAFRIADGPTLCFNPLWLSVLRSTQPLLSLERRQTPLPEVDTFETDTKWVQDRIQADGRGLLVHDTQTFVPTAAPSSSDGHLTNAGPPPWYTNPQTISLCAYLGIPNLINPPPSQPLPLPPTYPSAPGQGVGVSEEDEIRRIREAAQTAMGRQREPSEATQDHPEEINVVLSDDEDEANARWKEGAG